MQVKPTTIMLVGFAGIVVYLLVTSAKKAPSTTTGPVLPQGSPGTGGGVLPTASYAPATQTPAQQAAQQPSGTTQAGDVPSGAADTGGSAQDFMNALGGTDMPTGGV